jgi:hypothetical protein
MIALSHEMSRPLSNARKNCLKRRKTKRRKAKGKPKTSPQREVGRPKISSLLHLPRRKRIVV